MKKYSAIKNYIIAHKFISVISLLIFLAIAYFAYGKITATTALAQYVFGRVQKGDLVVSVSGSGQVATLSAVDIKPQTVGQAQTLGQIISVRVQNGDFVKAGQIIAILDGKNALQSLNQAKSSVDIAQANYNKLVNGPTGTDLQSLNNSIQSSENSIENLKENILIKLQNAYSGASNSVYLNTDPFFINPNEFIGVPSFSAVATLSISGVSFMNQTLKNNIESGRVSVESILQNWKNELASISTSSDLVSDLNGALSDLNKIRNYFDDMTTLFASYSTSNITAGQTTINSDKGIASNARSGIDSSISDLTSILQSYNSAQISLLQNQTSLGLKTAPPAADDITVSKSQLDNAKANLANAAQTYASRIITAPFDGQIGGLTAQVGQQVSSSDSLGKIITPQKVVNISLNEVDAAKVVANDSVNLTFDALPNVSIPGHISFIDPLGTVSQGVVSYAVRIAMDNTNDQIKTGMTASAEIVTTTHSNTLIIPTSAITTSGGRKYVLVALNASSTPNRNFNGQNGMMSSSTFPSSTNRRNFNFASSSFMGSSSLTFMRNSSSTKRQMLSGMSATSTPVIKVEVTVGISNNTDTEILSGLTEGELIVVRTIAAGTSAKTSAAAATTRAIGGGGGLGGLGGGGGAITRTATGRGN